MVSGLYEKRLNRPLFFLLVLAGVLWGHPAYAQQALAVGEVRDREGAAVAGARVAAFGPSGSLLGQGDVDVAGAFAFEVSGSPVRLSVRCAFCRPLDVAYAAGDVAVILIDRFRAVAQLDPSAADYAVLPYDRLADAIALRPYVVELISGSSVVSLSERGLNAGHGLLLDGGIAAYDRAAGSMNLWSLPARYAADVHVRGEEDAYRYGSYAGGGTFIIDAIGASRSSARTHGGATQDARIGLTGRSFAVLTGQSNDATSTAARSDARAQVRIGAGELLVGGALSRSAVGVPRQFVRWSTRAASARYVSAIGSFRAESAFAIDSGETITAARDAWSSNAFEARITRGGPIAFDAGYTGRRSRNDVGGPLIATQAQNALYAHAAAGGAALHVDASLAAFSLAVPGAHALALTPGLVLEGDIARGFRMHVAANGSLQAVPPVLASSDPAASLELLRASTYSAELQWTDVRRVSAALTAFSETAGDGTRRYGGWATRLAYQITPELALRAWALRGSASVSAGASEYGLASTGTGTFALTAREVMWLTYDRPGGLRVDAIYSRNGGSPADRHLDADLLVPLTAALHFYSGTSYVNRQRRYEFGLRF